jgi:vacuolar-type H+-ATPase subunit E/Vma4
MKSNKTVADIKESVLLDEVHRTESEIDAYLTEQTREAEAIIEEAQAKVEIEQKHIVREAETKFKEKYDQLLEEAKQEADRLLENGIRLVEDEQVELEKRKWQVVEKILELVLEKKP